MLIAALMVAPRAALVACLLLAVRARAIEPPTTAIGAGSTGGGTLADTEPEEDEEPFHPARDTLGGHVLGAAGGGLVVPFGSLEQSANQARLLDPSGGLSLDVGYGLNRTTVLGLSGQLGLLRGDSRCPGCSARTFAVGPTIRYHLVQGLAFDPWVSAGIGFRGTRLHQPGQSTTYLGLDWARLAVGGDWYPTRYTGLGPYLEMDLGSFLDKSTGTFNSGGVVVHFLAGLRAAFDFRGR